MPKPRGMAGAAKRSGQKTSRGGHIVVGPSGRGNGLGGYGNLGEVAPQRETAKGRKAPKAFCVCGSKMLATTWDDIHAGIQPRCPKCPPTEEEPT